MKIDYKYKPSFMIVDEERRKTLSEYSELMKLYLRGISPATIGSKLSVVDPQDIDIVEKPYTQTLEYNDSNNK